MPWILDADVTVKTLYGKQEGAVVGYNPHKSGRPSHTYHTYMIANLRLILEVEVATTATKVQPPVRRRWAFPGPSVTELDRSLERC